MNMPWEVWILIVEGVGVVALLAFPIVYMVRLKRSVVRKGKTKK